MQLAEGFPRYLLSKQSIDDRALNKDVAAALRAKLPNGPLSVVEIGAGIGTMLLRMLRWDLIAEARYILVDEMEENIRFGLTYLPEWAVENGFTAEQVDPTTWMIKDSSHSVTARFVHADVFEYLSRRPAPADLLVAHAFLDLMPLPERLPDLLSLTKDLAWLTLNFDGVSTLLPEIDPALDRKIERLYHQTMDERPGGGSSQTGRKLFGFLVEAGAEILSAGASDWIVLPHGGGYLADEDYFLKFILGFYRGSLSGHPELDDSTFKQWLQTRHDQIDAGQMMYLAHQFDFLVKPD